eukprot:6200865-Pleurochrysis_carterae.AAC.1
MASPVCSMQTVPHTWLVPLVRKCQLLGPRLEPRPDCSARLRSWQSRHRIWIRRIAVESRFAVESLHIVPMPAA